MENLDDIYTNQVEMYIKKNISLLENNRILLLNIKSQLKNILEIIGQINSKTVALGEEDSIYDLPYYWKIKYIKATVDDIRFPHSLFDSIFIFVDSKTTTLHLKPDELSRILKPNSYVNLIFIDKNSASKKEEYLDLLSKYFEILSDEKFVVRLKNKKKSNKRNINTIYVYHPNLLRDGITEYAKHLIFRLRKRGFNVVEGLPSVEDENNIVIVEYEELLATTNKMKGLHELPRNSFIEIHSRTIHEFRKDLIYLYHGIPSYYNLNFKEANWYYVPHIAYEIEVPNVEKKYDFCSFGFWSQFKRFDQIRKLKGKKKLVMSFNYLISDDKFVKEQCKKILRSPLGVICDTPLVSSRNLKFLVKLKYNLLRLYNVKVIVKDYIPFSDLIKELSECKSFVFFQETDAPSSGSMRLAAAFGTPVYAKDNLRSKDSQAIRFRDLKEIHRLPRESINIDDGLDYILALIEYKN